MKFVKMQGTGNDYVYVDCFKYEVKNPEEVARLVSDRHFGVGADGLILVCPSEIHDVRMDMYNADGSRGQMCGNGSRCVAKFAYDRGYVKSKTFVMETLAGPREIEVEVKDGLVERVCVDMGEPKTTSALPECIDIEGQKQHFVGIDVGNPHAVYYVYSKEELDALDLEKIGPFYENHARFPERVNTEFIYIEDEKNLHMRVWERGSGETLACGTGAVASAYATMCLGKCADSVTMHLRGGDLEITYERKKNHLFMLGAARYVFTGEIDIEKIGMIDLDA